MEISELDANAIGRISLCIAGTIIGGLVTYQSTVLYKRSQLSQSSIGTMASTIAGISGGLITFMCPIFA
jgi:hypothetical protein